MALRLSKLFVQSALGYRSNQLARSIGERSLASALFSESHQYSENRHRHFHFWKSDSKFLVCKPEKHFIVKIHSCPNKIMEANQIVPDVIDKAPAAVAKVTYSCGTTAEMGNELTPTLVKDEPKVQWEADENAFYTLCMTDPDAPSRKEPTYREWHHWLVGNIPGNDVSKGEVLSAYVGSGPPKGTGLHRYVFLVYKQSKKLEFDEKRLPNNSGDGRGKFSIRKFADKYKLEGPIAGNFYQAQWDDYVPKLYEQLGA